VPTLPLGAWPALVFSRPLLSRLLSEKARKTGLHALFPSRGAITIYRGSDNLHTQDV